MKTVLFYPRVENMILPSYAPLGIMSIATYLNRYGHQASVCDRFFSNEKVSSLIKEYKPDIIGISVISQTFIKDAIVISKEAKEAGIPVIWGGCSSTAIAETILRSGNADYISLNEGEFTWLEIAEAFDKGESFDEIKGLAYLKNGEYIQTEEREFIDLSVLPSVDWTLINPEKYLQKTYGSNKMLSIYGSKGCNGRCAFCYNPCFHKSTRRTRPLDEIIAEMRFLSENYGADGFEFTDELMFANRKEVLDFCNAITESGLKVSWSGYLKTSVINTQEDFELMYRAGCRILLFGIETGSKRILKEIHKPNNLDMVKPTMEACAKSGIVTIALFIIGLPGETPEDVKETISLAKSLERTMVSVVYFTPLPGSELYSKLIAEGKLPHKLTLEEHSDVIELENLYKNFSKIPTKELRVIKEYFRMRTLSYKTEESENNQFIKVIITTFQSWRGRGILHFFWGMFKTAQKVLRGVSIFLHPRIRRKYGLYFTK